TQAAATACIAWTSRSPPRPSLRSGSRRKASSPLAWARCSAWSRSSPSLRRESARHSASTASLALLLSSRSPATCRAWIRPSTAFRSSRATATASSTVRTEWSRPMAESQMGYQMRSAIRATSDRPLCRRTRSRSLPGASSPRPRLPTATRETCSPSLAVRNRSFSQRSVSAVRSLRAAAYERASSLTCCSPCSTPTPLSEGLRPALSRPHPDDRVDGDRPDLAVPDLACLRRLDDDVDDVLGVVLLDEDLHADLGHQVHLVLGAAVDLGVSTLAAVAARFADRHALDAEL